MDRQSAGKAIKLRLTTDAATRTVTATSEPAGSVVAAPTATVSAADAERAHQMTTQVRAAWKVTPMVAMLEEPLPPGVLARIIRPADATAPPMIVMSRASARMRVFNDARAVLVGDLVVYPAHDGERTVDLYSDGRIVGSDGGVRKIDLFDNASSNGEARQAAHARQLAAVLAKFDAAPQTTVGGKAAHILRWPE